MSITQQRGDERSLVRPAAVFDLRRHGPSTAFIVDGRTVSYAELADLVDDRTALLGDTRRLVLIECGNDLDTVVTYLAALAGGHPALLAPTRSRTAGDAQWRRVVEAYDPDVVASGHRIEELRPGTRHELHPDLALLLGTSGSTGSPKLVRLSRDNVRTNAAAIAGYLHLDGHSRAATTLPLQYCYGLSVLNSHLIVGGSLWLTETSVVDPGFWDDFVTSGATSFAGVPYTFDLLEQSGSDWTSTPGLCQITQAGGALPAERVRELARRCAGNDVELFVMYGQTEATARMAYLPAHLAESRAGTIGIAVEGGELRIDQGELVYSGPNVMLGYAESVDDLALGRTVHELRTGDLAVQHDDGLFEITGRCNRLAKLFGTRLDLDLVERLLHEEGIAARAVAHGNLLAVFVRDASGARRAAALVAAQHCLPEHAVRVSVLAELPMTASGKPDYAALMARASSTEDETAQDVPAALAAVLGRPVGPDDSFVSLGGDSLSYVEASVRLERLLGDLPSDWPQRTVAELAAGRRTPRRFLAAMETPVLLRALAILLIVASHTEFLDLQGGAHVLLAMVGFNLGRFALQAPTLRSRLRALGRGLVELLVPAMLCIGGIALATRDYDAGTVLLLNEWLGSDRWNDQWRFWFIAVTVWGTLAIAAVLCIPGVDRLQRRAPFGFAAGLVTAALALRFGLTGITAEHVELYSLATVAWCLLLGWLTAVTRTRTQRLVTTAAVLVGVVGFFGEPAREYVVLAGLLALLWLPRVLLPRVVVPPLGVLGAASLFIYLTHWVVYPPLDADHDFWAAVASLVVGTLVWTAWRRGVRGRR